MMNKIRTAQRASEFEPQEVQDIKATLKRIETYSMLAAKDMLTCDDVALLTGLSKSHVYKLTSTHQIPHYKPTGKMVYFDRSEIESWLRQNRVATEQEIQERAATYVATKSR